MTHRSDILLEARGVQHAYREDGRTYPVLHGVDLTLRRGEFTLIMGPSGCGKTTLLHILGLMMHPTAGRIELDGVELTGLPDAERTRCRRERIGFVFQRFNLLPILSARANVELALRLRRVPLDGQVGRVLEQVGLADKAHLKPRALSIGEQQRVAIARAVVGRPAILLADEPTGNLDSANADRVLALLRDIHAATGLTTLMITHNERLADVADRVLHMRDGRLTE
ncbi:MAG: ABC transporter ATP-binding protein [Phycisphaerae bacterium]|nr:ABC transporter ATP-binding protein [Phycisphaerae bacterium]